MTVIDLEFMESRKNLLIQTIDQGFKSNGIIYVKKPSQKKGPREISNISDFLNKQPKNMNIKQHQEREFEKNAKEVGSLIVNVLQSCELINQEEIENEDNNRNELCILNIYSPQQINASITLNQERTHSLPQDTLAVLPGPLLESSSNGRYRFSTQEPDGLIPYFYTRGKPKNDMHNGNKQMENLKLLFEAIDYSLVYFYATSSLSAITFPSLQKRVRQYSGRVLTIEHIQQILTICPSSYIISIAGNTYAVKAQGLPVKLVDRKHQFENALLNQQHPNDIPLHPLPEFTINDNGTKTKKRPAPASSNTPILKVQKKTQQQQTTKADHGTLLERIRAKEAAAKLDPLKDERQRQMKYEQYIQDQLPYVINILLSLQSKSYTFDQLIKLFADSMKLKLSIEESKDVIDRLSKAVPGFCTIVQAGKVNAVRLTQSGWNMEEIKYELCI